MSSGKTKKIEFDKTEENMKDLENITKLNTDIQDLIFGDPISSEDTDIEFQIQKVKDKDKNISVIKYDKPNFETQSPFSEDDILKDYIRIRDTINGMTESVFALLKGIPMGDSGMMKPALIQTITALYKQINDNSRLLMDMHDRILGSGSNKKGTLPSGGIGTQTNTFIFSGDTKDLNDIIKNATNHVEIGKAEIIDDNK